MKAIVLHEGSHLNVIKGAELKPGDVVTVTMEVIQTRDGKVLYPKGVIGLAGMRLPVTGYSADKTLGMPGKWHAG